MRKILETICVASLALLFLVTAFALFGSYRLPEQIPIHFDMAGQPDRWGSPASLQGLPFVALILYMFLTLASRYHSLAPFPAQMPLENRPRLEELALGMLAWIKVEMVGIFSYVQLTLIHAARHPERGARLLGVWILLGAILATLAWYSQAMFRVVRSDA